MIIFCAVVTTIMMGRLFLKIEKNHQKEIVNLKLQALKSDLKNYKVVLDRWDIKSSKLGFHPDFEKIEQEDRAEIISKIKATELIYTKINGWSRLDELYDKYY